MPTTRMDTNSLDPISREDGPIPEPDGGQGQLLPWGSGPFGGISEGDWNTALPRLYRPLSRFHTVSAVCSHPDLVALFHATSAHRISVFRAFSSSSAAISFDIRCSLVVTPACRSYQRTGSFQLPLPSVSRLAHLRWSAVPSSGRAPSYHARHQPYPSSSFRRVSRLSERPV